MARTDIDSLLSELGVPAGSAPAAPAGPAGGGPTDGLSDVFSEPLPEAETPTELGPLLVERGAVTAQQLATAQTVIRQSPGRRLVEVLFEHGADEVKVQECVAHLAGLAFERVDMEKGLDGGFDGKLLQRLGPDLCRAQMVLPLRSSETGAGGLRVVLGVVRPDDVFLLDEVRRRLGGAVALKPVVVTPFDIKGALEVVGQGEQKQESEDISALLSEVHESDVAVEKEKDGHEVDLEREAGESPVIKYVNYIIQAAVKEGASDIHVEPSDKRLTVRFRIDGELFESLNPPASMAAAIISRLKIMANLNIAEKRKPQDGRIKMVVQGREVDFRVSSLPARHGESMVLRIL
ncbi:MAG TPA: ATPase, T2SS/T4P/T4SS family, partial [Phycisphaerales bacterium]|nr:ATPase, T2SS/T4P/T4SS family [Phycisphaerales bacterium]